jgi:hypothetical protein
MPFIMWVSAGRDASAWWILGWPLFVFAFAMAAGFAATARGRSGTGWFWLSFLLLGQFALLFVLVMHPLERGIEERRLKDGELKRCPTCAELVRPEALKCRYCLAELDEWGVSYQSPPRPRSPALRELRKKRHEQG